MQKRHLFDICLSANQRTRKQSETTKLTFVKM